MPRSSLYNALLLGRISNLPTVWTNVLAGSALAGAELRSTEVVVLMVAMSLLYTGGMYLNDAFDHLWDRAHRPERPIPSGEVRRRTVYVAGFAMLLAGIVLVALRPQAGHGSSGLSTPAAVVTAALIVAYDAWHKGVALSPLLMGLTRVGVYATAGLCVVSPDDRLWAGAAALLCHIIGLSYVAKHETASQLARLWPVGFLLVPVVYGGWLLVDVGPSLGVVAILLLYAASGIVALSRVPGFGTRPNPGFAIPLMIANVSLLDGWLLASVGATRAALGCAALWVLVLVLQRKVPGS